MKKGQRRFWMVLYGLIAAVAGGLVVYVALNIDWGIRHLGEEDIDIGITREQYEADLRHREQAVAEELKQLPVEDRRVRKVLEKEKEEIERRLADTESSYQAYVEELKERIAQLEAVRDQVSDALVERACNALARGGPEPCE